MHLILILYWFAWSLVLYTDALFPVLLLLRGLIRPQAYRTAGITPDVSLVITVHNEEACIAARLDNVLALDYPSDRLEVIVASDGSSDHTNEIVRGYQTPGIRLLELPWRGKTVALNNAVAAASGEILVFSDANSIYHPESIRRLVAPFADPRVGGVAGNQRYLPKAVGERYAKGERLYWVYERLLKLLQSNGGNTIAATGAIYAIRRSLFRNVPSGVTDDFVISTSVILQGYRLVYVAEAVAWEPVATSAQREYNRKVRVITQGFRSIMVMRELLNPFRYGFYAVQLFTHKVLRRLLLIPLLVILLLNPLLWTQGLIYQLLLVVQIAFYGCALLGSMLEKKAIGQIPVLALPYYFFVVHVAAIVGLMKALRGHRIDLWEPQH